MRHAIRSQAGGRRDPVVRAMLTLRQDDILKVLQGHTDIREIRATCV